MRTYDAIIIGAGMAGMYQLHSLRKLGMSVRVLEAASEVGGTWYWNRYPGCRFDSETYSYCYSFDQEILSNWNWTEHFAPREETFRYLQYVADKLDLRKDIQFNTRVLRATWDESAALWLVDTDDGLTVSAKYLITALGVLSAPVMPEIDGRESFSGLSFHTADWPRVPLDLAGKRVAVIGTGATGVQVIQTIADKVGHLTVYQREGNWCAPLGNGPISPAEMDEIKGEYPNIFQRCRETDACFLHQADPRGTFEVTDEEREQFWEDLYAKRGFSLWMGNFHDVFTDEAAAAKLSEYVAKKIRARVKDPRIAEILIPKNHPFGAKRVPMETNYYEAYNRDNVELIDIKAEPIERITENGIVNSGLERKFDVIIFATGFAFIRGSYDRIDIRNSRGQTLRQKWADGPQTYMGIAYRDFPNLLAISGPHNGGNFCNVPRCIEQNVEFITAMLKFLRENDYDRVEASEAAELEWTEEVDIRARAFIPGRYDSYFNASNISGSPRRFLMYAAPQPEFRRFCDEVVAEHYRGFELSKSPAPTRAETVTSALSAQS